MIWYGSFFGDHKTVNDFFGIPNHHGEAVKIADQGDDKAVYVEGAAKKKTALSKVANTGQAPQGAIFHHPDNHVLDEAHYAPKWVKVSPFIAMLIGFVTALWLYVWDKAAPKRLAELNRPLYLFLLNKWYFDEIYNAIFVRPAKALGLLLWKSGDGATIDGTINGIAMSIIPFFTRLAGRAQSGYIFTYAFAMVIGIVVFVSWMTFAGGAK